MPTRLLNHILRSRAASSAAPAARLRGHWHCFHSVGIRAERPCAGKSAEAPQPEQEESPCDRANDDARDSAAGNGAGAAFGGAGVEGANGCLGLLVEDFTPELGQSSISGPGSGSGPKCEPWMRLD